MNVKRFTARTSREALRLVREALGNDAVVLSTKPTAGGVEVLAMAPEAMQEVRQMAALPADVRPDGRDEIWNPTPSGVRSDSRTEPKLEATSVEQDVAQMQMSTLSFQDYVRTRMLKKRREAIDAAAAPRKGAGATSIAGHHIDFSVDDGESPVERSATPSEIYAAATAAASVRDDVRTLERSAAERTGVLEQRMTDRVATARAGDALREPSTGADPIRVGTPGSFDAADAQRDRHELMAELRSMKGLIEERFGVLAFMEKLQRRPAEARLSQKLLDCGFSPALIRKIAEGLSADIADEAEWAAQILERNLVAQGAAAAFEEHGGVYALVGATGVGKTTTTAKIAAAFAARHGAGNLGLVTLDAYRVGAHEQLRAYGRILGVPVHTAHDRASLEDLLELLGGKKMVLIDTAGMAQRDTRTQELLEMLSHRSIQRLLVINAASQGETIEDVVTAYRGATCAGVVLSKLDEAVKLGPAIDAAIRHKLKIVGIANGQRVPEDWHHLSASALVQRALRGGGSSAWRFDASEMNLVFAAPHGNASRAAAMAA